MESTRFHIVSIGFRYKSDPLLACAPDMLRISLFEPGPLTISEHTTFGALVRDIRPRTVHPSSSFEQCNGDISSGPGLFSTFVHQADVMIAIGYSNPFRSSWPCSIIVVLPPLLRGTCSSCPVTWTKKTPGGSGSQNSLETSWRCDCPENQFHYIAALSMLGLDRPQITEVTRLANVLDFQLTTRFFLELSVHWHLDDE